MKRYIDPVFNCVLGVGAPLLIVGGVAAIKLLVKAGGFWRIIGALATLVGCLFLLVVFIMLMHDTVWPAIRSKPAKTPPRDPWSKPEEP